MTDAAADHPEPGAESGTDLFATLVAEVQAPLDAWLHAQGVTPELALTVPTREGAGDLALPCHKYSKPLRKAPRPSPPSWPPASMATRWWRGWRRWRAF